MKLRTITCTAFYSVLSIGVLLAPRAFGQTGPSSATFEELWFKGKDRAAYEREAEQFCRELVSQPDYLERHANLSKLSMISLVKRPWDKDEVRQQYIDKQIEHYSNQINMMKNNGESQAAIEATIQDLLAEQEWTDGQDLYEHPEKFLNKAALCLVAAQIRATVPLELLEDEFGFSVRSPSSHITPDLQGARHVQLRDYPLMYLATQCGEKSIPFLRRIIQSTKSDNPRHWDHVRLQALVVLRNIDEQEAANLIPDLARSLTEKERTVLEKYLENPVKEPWSISGYVTRTTRRYHRGPLDDEQE